MIEEKEEQRMERCNLCWGRGYKPERRNGRNDGGFYARTCKRCNGSGQVPEGSRNPEARVRK